MIPVADILTRLDVLLNDADRVRWTTEERIDWINDAMGAIMIRRPSTFARTAVLSLAAGTRQEISGSLLLDVVRNVAADGVTPGSAIRRTDRQLLDDIDIDWHKGKQKAIIRNFTFDERAQKVFYCYPPAIAGTKVELLEAVLPAQVTAQGDNLDINPEYMEPTVNYVAFRAYSKDSDYAPQAAVAAAYLSAFESGIGYNTKTVIEASPNQPATSV